MNKIIPIVFSFDNNFAKPAYIAISSLIHSKYKNTHYNIYCIISKDVEIENINEIKNLVNNKSSIDFIVASDEFDNAHQHRKITTAAYYRLIIHKLLPHEEKVLYCDVDVLFQGDLYDVYNTELGINILGGVKNLYIHQVFEKHIKKIPYWNKKFSDSKYSYINSGFLIMNLKEIRRTEIWKDWINLSSQPWEYHDQDILNMTCKGKITYLDPKYNASYPIRAKGADNWDLFTKEELSEKPIMLHYTALKPWNAKYMKQSNEWWKFVKKYTPLHSYFLKKYRKIDTINKKYKRLQRRILNKLNKQKI